LKTPSCFLWKSSYQTTAGRVVTTSAASNGAGTAAAILSAMPATLVGVDADRLERSCSGRDAIRLGSGAPGLERAEVYLSAFAFEPHRHDTYAIGLTTAGVQTFRYRGSKRASLPGQLVIIHPDETHDGAAGTDAGLGYRSIYVAPELVREALDGAPLPFVADPIQKPTPATRVVVELLADIDEPISDFGRVEIATLIADALRSLSGRPRATRGSIAAAAVERAREYLAAHAGEQTSAATLEQITGADRFTLTRHFRRALGTSPDRYRTLRRLELARHAIDAGFPLVRAALEAGFADQSHMTRQFKRTYGMTPSRWTALTASAAR
jgi:AraC-like DNA-binding protein